MKIDITEIEKFAKDMIKTYNDYSKLKGISNLVDYSDSYKELEYIQIAKRIYLPKEFFSTVNKSDNTQVSYELAKVIAFGEITFVMNKIIKYTENDKITKLNLADFSYENVIKIINTNVDNPTDIFLPIDKLFHKIQEWVRNGDAHYKGGELFIKYNNIKVHWSNVYTKFDKIVVLNRNNIKIVQKNFDDMITPIELKNVKYSYKSGEKLSIYFAESDDTFQFDFYFRCIIAIANIHLKSTFVLELSDTTK